MRKVMVITGTSKGIGRHLTEYFLDKGFIVNGCDLSETDLLHDSYTHTCLNVSDEKAVRKMVSTLSKKYNKVDYLINNAGIASMNHSFLTPLSTAEKVFKTNVFGSFLFSREVGRIMSKNKFGRIVNFTSVAVPLRLEGEAVYAASKSAVEILTKVMAKELSTTGITCNAIGPSPMKTDLIRNISEEKIQRLLEQQAIADFATFEDVTNVIEFFLSDKSYMITGQVIYLCGVG